MKEDADNLEDLKNNVPKDYDRESARLLNCSTRPSDPFVSARGKAMNLEIGPNSYEMWLEIDKHRIKLAERSLSDRVKEERTASR
ncbi:hypothetical protein TNCT_297701 [Trichonephila clavata]|uniref:Uncharacterized protein n=1 Tax=Trichonephila clavata TaxID=2740835 RepID=A0A8X6LYZ5_TRICU|nr:hypothetical protein TNCT_297701 [Trichonephila clavata]